MRLAERLEPWVIWEMLVSNLLLRSSLPASDGGWEEK